MMTPTIAEKLGKLTDAVSGIVAELKPKSTPEPYVKPTEYFGPLRGRLPERIEAQLVEMGLAGVKIAEERDGGTSGLLGLKFEDGSVRLVKLLPAEIESRRTGNAAKLAANAPTAPAANSDSLEATISKAVVDGVKSARFHGSRQGVPAAMSKPASLEDEWSHMPAESKREFFNSFKVFAAFRRHNSAVVDHGRVYANGDSKFICRNDDEPGHGQQPATEAGLRAEFEMLSAQEKADFGSADRYVALRKRELAGQIQIFGKR